MSLKVLFLGEIVGRAGILTIKEGLKEVIQKYEVSYVVANAEGATNGFGLGKAHSVQLNHLGINLLTGGEKLFYKLDMVEFLPKCSFVLRAANYPLKTPGKSYKIVEIDGKKLAIINMQGHSGFNRICVQNPLLCADALLNKLEKEVDYILISFHSATTAESATFAHYLKGRVAAVIGTHSKVLTSDYTLLSDKTAFISDNGRCGSFLSVGGFNPKNEISKLMSAVPERSHEAWDDCELQGALVTLDDTHFASSILPIRHKVNVTKPEVTK